MELPEQQIISDRLYVLTKSLIQILRDCLVAWVIDHHAAFARHCKLASIHVVVSYQQKVVTIAMSEVDIIYFVKSKSIQKLKIFWAKL